MCDSARGHTHIIDDGRHLVYATGKLTNMYQATTNKKELFSLLIKMVVYMYPMINKILILY